MYYKEWFPIGSQYRSLAKRCQQSPVGRVLLTDPMILGSNPPSGTFSLRVRREAGTSRGRREDAASYKTSFPHESDINFRCPDSSVVRFLRIDLMVSGSNLPSARLSLTVRRATVSL